MLAAAKVGGILANRAQPVEFLRENLLIQSNVIDASFRAGVRRLLFLASSAIYPRDAPQPISESCLLTGPPDPSNRGYALAKIAGVELCWSYNRQHGTRYLAAAVANVYGPGDHFEAEHAHVLAALMRRTAEAQRAGAQELIVWGTGTPRREMLYVDDLARACVFLLNLEEAGLAKLVTDEGPPLINVGTGEDVTIRELAETVARVVGFRGDLVFDTTKPDGVPRKLMEPSRMTALGWRYTVGLEEGVKRTWETVRERFGCEPPAPSAEGPPVRERAPS